MIISKIRIKNYRSCKDTVFEPNRSLSTLIGANGSGKTNALSAIRLLGNLLTTRRFRPHRPIETPESATEIKTWFVWNGATVIHTATLSVATNERNEDEILESTESWYMFDISGHRRRNSIPLEVLSDAIHQGRLPYTRRRSQSQFLNQYLSERGFDEKCLEAMLAVAEFVSKISYYSASQFTNPANCPISFEVEAHGGSNLRRGISIRSSHQTFLYEMYLQYKRDSEAYAEFLNIIGPTGIGLVEAIDFKEVETSSSTVSVMAGGKVRKGEKINLLVVPGFEIASETLSPSQLSEGTFKTLALVFYLVTDQGSILMIEEPEVCIHHGLLNSIIELIKIYSREKQIFISTHSDAVLDHVDLDGVYVVKRDKTLGTKIRRISSSMSKREKTALAEYLETEGSLGELWKHGDLENE